MTSDARCRSLRRGRGRGRDGLDLLFGVPCRFEVLARGSDVKVVRAYAGDCVVDAAVDARFSCQGGTGLQASVSLDGVLAVVFSADAIFFFPGWM